MNFMLIFAISAAMLWWLLLSIPWQPWRCRESLDSLTGTPEEDLSGTTVLIPARNEAGTLGTVLQALAKQGRNIKVVVIDDESEDETAKIASDSGLPGLRVIKGSALPTGWTGKLWALEQGSGLIDTPYLLLLDADIHLAPGTIRTLHQTMARQQVQLVSLMAAPHLASFWERLLMPAFNYFFKLLYPFALSNRPRSFVAAAAGGCILMQATALKAIGSFASLRDELIDDCALARRIKKAGFSTWIGLSHSATSLRHQGLGSIWNMVARTAFTQLRYSVAILIGTTLTLLLAFVVPLLTLTYPGAPRILGIIALIGMGTSYIPTLNYYRLSPIWVIGLPCIGVLYLLMTLTSALNNWLGNVSLWKGRRYAHDLNQNLYNP